MEEEIKKQLRESAKVKIKTADELSEIIASAARMIIEVYKKGGKILLAGNGGSAADAQHIAAELVGRFKKERKAMPALALTTNTSILTALGNDYGFDAVFARGVEAFGESGKDVLIAITTSGNSSNIKKAVEVAKSKQMHTIGLLGNQGGALKQEVDIAIVVPSDDTQRIQEAHITIGHILCDLVEQGVSGDT